MSKYLNHIKPLEINDAIIRLLNIGSTIVISATDGRQCDAMAATWCCNLDSNPPKLTIVLDKSHKTRRIIESLPEDACEFIIQVPNARSAGVAFALGSISANDDPQKLEHCGAEFFDPEGKGRPFLKNCNAWLLCRLISEPANQTKYDLFIAEVKAAWADDRVYDGHHWHFKKAGRGWRTIHYVQGGRFYMIGRSLDLPEVKPAAPEPVSPKEKSAAPKAGRVKAAGEKKVKPAKAGKRAGAAKPEEKKGEA